MKKELNNEEEQLFGMYVQVKVQHHFAHVGIMSLNASE